MINLLNIIHKLFISLIESSFIKLPNNVNLLNDGNEPLLLSTIYFKPTCEIPLSI